MPSKRIRDLEFHFPNAIEFSSIYEEIFKNASYYVDLDTLSPTILDVGAHVGVASLYFKQTYPFAKITAFEPLPELCQFFEKNMESNHIDDVTLVQAAAWTDDGVLRLHVDAQEENHWLSTSSVRAGAWNARQDTVEMSVPCVRLSTYLEQSIDILKLDIEGAETDVVREIQHQLHHVRHLLIEFHATGAHRPEPLLKILQNHGKQVEAYFEGKRIPLDRLTRRKSTLYLLHAFAA